MTKLKKNILTPTEISEFDFCSIKWFMSRGMRRFSPQEVYPIVDGILGKPPYVKPLDAKVRLDEGKKDFENFNQNIINTKTRSIKITIWISLLIISIVFLLLIGRKF